MCSIIWDDFWMQGKERMDRQLLDAGALVGHLVPAGSMFAFLAAQLHRAADESGVAVTLLHYEQVHPVSGPFWNQQGYRPLWTSGEARPAGTLR